MQLDIQYKIKTKRHGAMLCKQSNLFPVLSIRYRKKGSRRWVDLGRREIDVYAFHRFRNTYYKDFKADVTDLMTLESKSDYERLTLFMDILNTEFHGSINKFVKSITLEHAAMTKAEDEECKDVNRISHSMETNGCVIENLCW